MTAPVPDAPEVPRSGNQCPSCPHPLGTHDAIARRYCAATETAHGTDRGCVCGTVQDHQSPEGPRGHKSHTSTAFEQQKRTER
ncbi:RGCVC family protein [Amycolatopsis sp. NPDC051106]|uniref:RGCVC family protein n=1 Tax=unclassified Amycolatopsis TaxID=2618356 RepID=UPI003440CC48